MKKILLIDNFDSFTYNIATMVKEIGGATIDVVRSNQIHEDLIQNYNKIIVSPGSGIPRSNDPITQIIKHFAPTKDILGISFGHLAIAVALGCNLLQLKHSKHGVSSHIQIDTNDSLYTSLDTEIQVGLYHSWVIDKESLPADLYVTAHDNEQNIMSISHRKYKVKGVQYNPESILTPIGSKILKNWINS